MNTWKRAGALVVFLLFFSEAGFAAAYEFTYTPLCIEASRNISSLRLKTARQLLDQERAAHPQNCAVDYLENYLDFYTLITDPDMQRMHELEPQKAKRLARLNNLPDQSPFKLYAQSEINLQWAFTRIWYEEYVSAALEFRESYKLLERNIDLFPFFAPNFKNQGMLKAMLGGVPENLRWILKMVGMKGDFREGMGLLINFIDHQSYTPDQLLEKQSAEYYYLFLQLNLGDKQLCWQFCERSTRDYTTNLMSCYLRAFIGTRTGHNDQALEALVKQPTGTDYIAFPVLDYLHGVALQHKLDTNAIVWFKRYVSLSKGQNLIKDAYKRLSWIYLLEKDQAKFQLYRNMVKKYGAAISEEDKAALKESLTQKEMHPGLLRARLLFDGGYYERALAAIQQTTVVLADDKIEYEYRYGRICAELKQYLRAIEHYENCIELSGPGTHLHYAPYSCNQLGAIYERLGNKTQARNYYQKTLTYKGYDYRGSATSFARNGLERLKS